MSSLKERWEKRANEFGTSPRGVLFHRFPEALNSALDQWHQFLVRDVLLPHVGSTARLLDLGCGYGRLSATFERHRPDADIIGCDLAETYCRQYLQQGGRSVCARAEALPFAAERFDGIVAVTVLMYVEPMERAQILQSLARLLRPGGCLLVVDPGAELLTLLTQLGLQSTNSSGGHGFSADAIDKLARSAGLAVKARGSNIFQTLSLPMILPWLSRWPNSGKRLLSFASSLDRKCSWNASHTLHRYSLLQKPEL